MNELLRKPFFISYLEVSIRQARRLGKQQQRSYPPSWQAWRIVSSKLFAKLSKKAYVTWIPDVTYAVSAAALLHLKCKKKCIIIFYQIKVFPSLFIRFTNTTLQTFEIKGKRNAKLQYITTIFIDFGIHEHVYAKCYSQYSY